MPTVTEAEVIEAIRKVYDPEIPVNVHDLGLIYGVDIDESGEVVVRMTLTAPNCPVAESLPAAVAARVREVPGVTSAKVDIVFDPPWDSSRMSEDAKLALGLGLLQL
jgi:FeS assembly SUF system protein